MVIELTVVAAVEAVIQVVPDLVAAVGLAHHAGDRGHGRCADETARLGNLLHRGGQLGQRLADRGAEAVDVELAALIIHRETAADVQHPGLEPQIPGLLHDLAAGVDGLHVATGVGHLGADVERQPHHLDPLGLGQLQQRQRLLRGAAELLGEIDLGLGIREADAQQQFDLVLVGQEFLQLQRVVIDKHGAAEFQRITDVAVALDGMGVNAASRANPLAAHQIHFAIGGQIETGPLFLQDRDHRLMGQGLECIVQAHIGQGGGQGPILFADGCLVEQQQGGAKLFNQLTVILCDQGLVHSLLIILRGRDMPKPYAIEPATAGSGEWSGGTDQAQCITPLQSA
ncbi:hypothetical protein D3C84_596280 [compost metagenome]